MKYFGLEHGLCFFLISCSGLSWGWFCGHLQLACAVICAVMIDVGEFVKRAVLEEAQVSLGGLCAEHVWLCTVKIAWICGDEGGS